MKKEQTKNRLHPWVVASFIVFWMTVGVNTFAEGTHLWTAVHVAGLIISIGALTTMGINAKEWMKMRKSKEG